ncbi:ATP-binding protein [Amycolatopsis nalaikhensis]|uniref:ATP-binding protein n=1 Tax=Amycolatopsis nalaikhensis TaxID=715472 RepID=A0ABY8XFA2_9PSEU|nr:ATP-binding protein [Amycolatopsis sp. 2-2]WIV54288.1 ATP-binding protein [Amycolatopsis sp. 2-2]
MPVTWDGDDRAGWQHWTAASIGLAGLAAARHWAEDELATLGEAHRIDALLVVSELLDNAYRHAGGPVQLRLLRRHDPCEITVAVADSGSGAPRMRTPDPRGGRGLLLVDRICSAWGVSHHDDGKVVWGTLGCAESGLACTPSRDDNGAGRSR